MGLFVSVRGEVKLARVEEVKPTGSVALPGTLSITQPSDAATPVHIRVAGYKKGQVIAVRDAVTTVPTGRISLLRLPVQWLSSGSKISGKQRSDTGATPAGAGVTLKADPIGAASNFPEFAPYFEGLVVPCAAGETLVDGTCAPIDVSGLLIPSTNNEHAAQLFGGAVGIDDKGAPQGGSCFPVEECFTESEEVSLESLGADCALPISSVPTSQINFAIQRKTRGEMKFVVPLDYVETPGKHTSGGFYEKEGKYHLPKAICERALGRRDDIAALRVSTTCKSKTAATPTCGPWSAVNTKQQAAPSAGKYFAADAGTDAADAAVATGWTQTRLGSSGVTGITAMGLTRSRIWVAGDQGKAVGLGLTSFLNRLEFAREADGGTNSYPPGVAVANEHVAVLFPHGTGNVAIRRSYPATETFETVASADGMVGAGITDNTEDIVLAFEYASAARFLKVYSPTARNGDLYRLPDVQSFPGGLSFPPGSRIGYLTAGVSLYRLDAAPMFLGTVTGDPPHGATRYSDAPLAYATGGGRVLGVYATSDTAFWGMSIPGEAGVPLYGILRTSLSSSGFATEWISGISVGAFGLHGIPPLVVGEGFVYFTDGTNVYRRRATESGSVPVSTLTPLYTAKPNEGGISALAYAGGKLYGALGNGEILAGPVQ
ncbi:MAG: hypothetical protein JNM74_21335 [Myxococcales bacterium]|nr:hypothetical protein [Myxococcales bacterium]